MTTTRRTKLTLTAVAAGSVTAVVTALLAPTGALAERGALGERGAVTQRHGTDHHLRATLQRDADALLAQGAPGVLVGLEKRGRDIAVRSGFGDVATRTPVPWDARFRIGSFTKTYVSATLLQLVGEGKLSLDDPVERWLPGVVRGNGNDGRRVTVRQLLQQNSGLPEFLQGMPWLFTEAGFLERRFESYTGEQLVRFAMAHPPEFAPGERWSYSNTNYILAGMVIEKVTRRTWQQEVERRIVRPLGLRDTTAPVNDPDLPRPHAVGYERFPLPGTDPEDPQYGGTIDATRQNPSWGGAAGAMISTTDDGNRFIRALIGGRVLRPAQLAEMLRTVPTNDEFRVNWPGARYGLGIMWVPNSCGGSWSHGGDIMGFQTRNGVSADGSRSVMVSINTDSFVPDPGAPKVEGDVTLHLIDHALCD